MGHCPFISVIIPIYKVEAYIERCARSLFEQTLKTGIEFIFVNDCTPDNSMAILAETLKQYPNRADQVKIIHLEKNGGSANARHVALRQASGIYIGNCDSDDWVEPDMYETLLNHALAHDYDMVWCDFYRSTADGTDTYVRQNVKPEKYTLLGAYLSGCTMGSLWNRIYKKSLYASDFVYPQHDMTEDWATIIQLTLNSNKIGYIPRALNHYFLNDVSISQVVQPEKILKRCDDTVANADLIFELLEKQGLSLRYEKEIVAKKLITKDVLDPLLGDRQYRYRWRTLYPEAHGQIMTNPYFRLMSRIRFYCLAHRLYCHWLRIKLSRRGR